MENKRFIAEPDEVFIQEPDRIINGETKHVLRINLTPLVVQITDGSRHIQLRHFGKDAFIVPGNIYQFASRLEDWIENLLTEEFPPVVSSKYEEMGLLEALQSYSDRYINEARWNFGVSLTDLRRDLWKEFWQNYLPKYLDDRRGLNKAFTDALTLAFAKYKKDRKLRRI
jgi:hypothetical protein